MASGWNSYEQITNGDRTAECQRLSGLVSSNIQKLNNNVQQIERMVNQLGTSQDSDDLRHSLHQLQHSTNELSKDTNNLLKDLNDIAKDQRQWKLQRERLTNDLLVVLNKFQRSQRDAAIKEKESIKRVQDISTGAEDALSSASKKNTQLQMERNVDVEAVRERQEAIIQIESDIHDVGQIFKDLAVMVSEQGQIVDDIEANIETANVRIHEGASDVSRAAQYKASARRKKLCLLVFAVGLLLIVILAIFLYTRK